MWIYLICKFIEVLNARIVASGNKIELFGIKNLTTGRKIAGRIKEGERVRVIKRRERKGKK